VDVADGPAEVIPAYFDHIARVRDVAPVQVIKDRL
jgi:hypothetical protein